MSNYPSGCRYCGTNSKEDTDLSKIVELRQKRAETWDKAKAFLDERRGEDGIVSAEDNEQYERMESEVVNLGKEIERMERVEAMDRELSRPTAQPLTNRPDALNANEDKPGIGSRAYADAFWQHMRNRSNYDVRNVLRAGQDSEGGFLVPDEFERTLVQGLEEENIMRKLAHVIRTSSGDRKIPMDELTSYLWSQGDVTEAVKKVRRAMREAGFAMEEETDRGYSEPAYSTDTNLFTVAWTWVGWEEVADAV